MEEARKIRTQQSGEDQNELIEIHPDLLDKPIAAPMLTKGKYISDNYTNSFIDKGRIAFLLKRSRPARFGRKKPTEYNANLEVLKLAREKIKESDIERIQHEEEAKEEQVDMNVDSRPISYDSNSQENERSRRVYQHSRREHHSN